MCQICINFLQINRLNPNPQNFLDQKQYNFSYLCHSYHFFYSGQRPSMPCVKLYVSVSLSLCIFVCMSVSFYFTPVADGCFSVSFAQFTVFLRFHVVQTQMAVTVGQALGQWQNRYASLNQGHYAACLANNPPPPICSCINCPFRSVAYFISFST